MRICAGGCHAHARDRSRHADFSATDAPMIAPRAPDRVGGLAAWILALKQEWRLRLERLAALLANSNDETKGPRK